MIECKYLFRNGNCKLKTNQHDRRIHYPCDIDNEKWNKPKGVCAYGGPYGDDDEGGP